MCVKIIIFFPANLPKVINGQKWKGKRREEKKRKGKRREEIERKGKEREVSKLDGERDNITLSKKKYVRAGSVFS